MMVTRSLMILGFPGGSAEYLRNITLAMRDMDDLDSVRNDIVKNQVVSKRKHKGIGEQIPTNPPYTR